MLNSPDDRDSSATNGPILETRGWEHVAHDRRGFVVVKDDRRRGMSLGGWGMSVAGDGVGDGDGDGG